MSPFEHLWRRLQDTKELAQFSAMIREERAAQIVEFAVALPLLIVFVVGIFDFSNAFTLKQKLTNVARDAARTAAAEPTSDLGNAAPISVTDAFYVIDDYLKANNINDCGVTTPGLLVAKLTWQFSVAAGSSSPCGIVITINRGYYFDLPQPTQAPGVTCAPQTPGQGLTQVLSTCVSIQYTYPWRFGQVATLIGGGNSMLPTVISGEAVAGNEF